MDLGIPAARADTSGASLTLDTRQGTRRTDLSHVVFLPCSIFIPKERWIFSVYNHNIHKQFTIPKFIFTS